MRTCPRASSASAPRCRPRPRQRCQQPGTGSPTQPRVMPLSLLLSSSPHSVLLPCRACLCPPPHTHTAPPSPGPFAGVPRHQQHPVRERHDHGAQVWQRLRHRLLRQRHAHWQGHAGGRAHPGGGGACVGMPRGGIVGAAVQAELRASCVLISVASEPLPGCRGGQPLGTTTHSRTPPPPGSPHSTLVRAPTCPSCCSTS